MKEPKHPVGPAFDRAREAEDAWRQQQIAALTQEQRREYDRRVQDEQKKLKAEKQRIEAQKPQRVEAQKQSLLSGKPAPELRMLPRQAMKGQKAGVWAKVTVEQKSNAQVERAGIDARERLDGYLRHAERERGARRQQEQTARRESNEKAQSRPDDALARAFQKAHRQQQQSQQRERAQQTQEQAHSRERDRN